MKKQFLLVLICFLCIFALSAQPVTPPQNGPEIKFNTLVFDFGEVKVGESKTVSVIYTNVGNRPLILDNVISSCDCTEVIWSKAPLMPHKTDTIKATYTAKESGLINKRVTVLSNALTERIILSLKGKVP
jgi:hypothetical protein